MKPIILNWLWIARPITTQYGHMATLTALHQVPVRIAPIRRLSQLFAGLWLYGASMGMHIRSTLGLDPWDVLHEGLARRTGLSFGLITAITGVLVLLVWIPLKQKPGVGTIANVVVIAISVDVTLAIIPAPQELLSRIVLLVLGIVLNAVAFAAYVGSRLGPGPRDGMVTGFCRRTGVSLRLTRTVVELLVLGTGWLLGGTVGIGTILYAVSIGPLAQLFLPALTWRERSQPAS
ncbi:putative membrane protein YczE [Lentzea atacamensis]|uniref:Putative membrane protein YczE n=2 Tax=Lentzea atacamensis TaxID=531938 RepID=A0A316ISZ4_9PSEU|nr:putative membrane protein YczE [Lentzea atacamensis]